MINVLYFCFQLLFSFNLSSHPIVWLFSFPLHHFILYQSQYRHNLPLFVSFTSPFFASYYHTPYQQLIPMKLLVCLHFIAKLVQLNLDACSMNMWDSHIDVHYLLVGLITFQNLFTLVSLFDSKSFWELVWKFNFNVVLLLSDLFQWLTCNSKFEVTPQSFLIVW